jgi:CheY-like chemotaxis protein
MDIQWPENLVAEDNAVNQEILRIALTEKGLQPTIVGDGFSAVDAFCKGYFDIILMDIQMPKMDGLAATAAIRALENAEQRRVTPIVALTANMMVEET